MAASPAGSNSHKAVRRAPFCRAARIYRERLQPSGVHAELWRKRSDPTYACSVGGLPDYLWPRPRQHSVYRRCSLRVARWAGILSTTAACRRKPCWRPQDVPKRHGMQKIFGVEGRDTRINFPEVHRHVHAVIAAVAPNASAEHLTALGVRVISVAGQVQGPQCSHCRRHRGSCPPLCDCDRIETSDPVNSRPRQRALSDERKHFRPCRETGASHHHRGRVDRS